jgi:hypothetical protein
VCSADPAGRRLEPLSGTARQERRERYSSGTLLRRLRHPAPHEQFIHGTLSHVSKTPPGPQPPPAVIAEATKRAGLVWITIGGQHRPRPAWHIWRTVTGPQGGQPGPARPAPPGAAYVLTGPGEQPLPGLADSGRVTVTVAGGQPGGALLTWTATVSRVEPGSGEWDEVIGQLVAGRLNMVLAAGETSPAQRWARSGAVFRLAPTATDDPATTSMTPGSARPSRSRST